MTLLQQQQVVESLLLQTPTQVLFQQSRYPPMPQHPALLSQFHSPIQDLCSAYRDSLQAPRPSDLASGNASDPLRSYSTLPASFQPVVQTMSIQGPVTMQVAISTEPRHCLSLTYGSSYFSRHHSYAAGCFDGWKVARGICLTNHWGFASHVYPPHDKSSILKLLCWSWTHLSAKLGFAFKVQNVGAFSARINWAGAILMKRNATLYLTTFSTWLH